MMAHQLQIKDICVRYFEYNAGFIFYKIRQIHGFYINYSENIYFRNSYIHPKILCIHPYLHTISVKERPDFRGRSFLYMSF